MYLILWTGMGFVNGFLSKTAPKLRFHHFHQNFIRTFIQNAHKKRSLISETSFCSDQLLFYIRLTNVSITFSAAPNAAAATL